MFHKDKPVDWLMDHILWVKVCNPEKDQVSSYLLFYSEAFTPKHQYTFSLYCSLYISYGTDKENFFNNQEHLLVNDHFLYSRDINI